MMLFTNRNGWHQNIAGLADGLTFRTRADYDNYLKRLAPISGAQRRGAAGSARAR